MAKLPVKSEIIALLSPHLEKLEDRGRWIMACCPYHDDSNPSFGIDTRNGGFNCFACNTTGTFKALLDHIGIENELEEIDAMSEGEWVNMVRALDYKERERDRVEWPGQDTLLYPLSEERDPSYHKSYLHSRGITDDLIKYFHICSGADDIQSIFIPVESLSGDEVIWVERRRIDGRKPKYWRPKGVRKELALFGYSNIERHDWVVITEGIFDAIALAAYSLPAVCCFGGFSLFQRNAIVKRFDRAYIAFDGDIAGKKKAREAKGMLMDCGIDVINVNLPKGKDPADVPETVARGIYDNYSRIKNIRSFS